MGVHWSKRTVLWGVAWVGIPLVLACTGWNDAEPPTPAPPPVQPPSDPVPVAPPAVASSLDEAASAWVQHNCSACHGARGQGGVGPQLAGRVPNVDDLRRQLRRGAEPMPAYPEEVVSESMVLGLHAWLVTQPTPGPPAPNPDTIATQDGVDVELVVSGLEHPIALAFHGDDLYVSTNGTVYPREGVRSGAVHRIRDGVATQVADALERPVGLLWFDGALWVSQRGRVTRLEDRSGDGVFDARRDVLSGLPTSGLHQNNGLTLGPDGRVWMGMGSATNADVEEEPNNSILALNTDGTYEVMATGFRNPFGLTVMDGVVFATDNGIDPPTVEAAPEEIHRVTPGGFHGHPFWTGNTRRTEGGPQSVAPLAELTPHASANGITAGTGSAFPDLQDQLIVAEFGSYISRFRSAGRQIVTVDPRTGESTTWASGFVGRPLDLVVGPDGAVYVTDFEQGAVWRFFASDRVRTVFRPSFDCQRASTEVEHAICNDPELSRLDGQLADAYQTARSAVSSDARSLLRREQREWIAQRDGCASDPWPVLCTRDAMVERIAQLQNAAP